jgi:hypothetical protein
VICRVGCGVGLGVSELVKPSGSQPASLSATIGTTCRMARTSASAQNAYKTLTKTSVTRAMTNMTATIALTP